MNKKWMTALALALLAPAAFGQANMPAEKVLRGEIVRDKGDLSAKLKAERAQRKQLLVQEKAELAKIRESTGTRAEKKQARQAVRQKYAKLAADAHQKSAFERKNLREDMQAKRGQIKKLRQS